MKLISCNHCAIILDADKLNFRMVDKEDGSIDERYADYNQRTGKWEAYVLCPLCEEKVFNE